MTRAIFLLPVLLHCSLVSAQVLKEPSDRQAIEKVMSDQQDAWNRGDIDAFMQGYWNSEKLVFVSGGGMNYGWETTRSNYYKRYPDREAMGSLTFVLKDVVQIDKETIRVIGTFHLARTIGDIGGFFTLIFKKIEDEWLIISDHTSTGG